MATVALLANPDNEAAAKLAEDAARLAGRRGPPCPDAPAPAARHRVEDGT